MENEKGEETNQLYTDKNYRLKLCFALKEKTENVRFVIGITRTDGIYFYGAYVEEETALPEKGEVVFDFKNALLKGEYVLDLWIEPLNGEEAYESIYSLMQINVDTEVYFERGFMTMQHSWKLYD